MHNLTPDHNAYRILDGNKIQICQSDGAFCEPWWEPGRPGAEFQPAQQKTIQTYLNKIGMYLAEHHLHLDMSMLNSFNQSEHVNWLVLIYRQGMVTG